MNLTDIITLAKEGYKPSDIKELIALAKAEPKEPDPKEPNPKEPEPKEPDPKEPDPKEPEPKEPDPKEPEPKEPDPKEPDYKSELEKAQNQIKELQKEIRKHNNESDSDDPTKTDDEKMVDIFESFLD